MMTNRDSGQYTGDMRDQKPHGRGKNVYNNGDVYDGIWTDGARSGFGKMQYSNGDVYEGQWEDDKRSGHGFLSSLDGVTYSGSWLKDQKHGHGRLSHKTGSVYEGNFANNLRNGMGQQIFANGNKYSGHWQDNQQSGAGITVYHNGNIYEGNYLNGKKSGYGRQNDINGDEYDGEWQNGMKHGNGTLKFVNGDTVVGKWKNDDIDGYGALTEYNRDSYTGQWQQTKRCGYGQQKYADGCEYNGHWLKGQKNGYGILTMVKQPFAGHIYQGIFVNDQPEGAGIYMIPEGMVFQGEFAGYNIGKGTATAPNGDAFSGAWKNLKLDGNQVRITLTGEKFNEVYESGILQSSIQSPPQQSVNAVKIKYNNGHYEGFTRNGKPHCLGQIIWANGDKYHGEWLNGYQTGYGQLNKNSGDVYVGNWRKGKQNGFGKYTYKNGDAYQGSWTDDKRSGFGILKMTTGDVYSGYFDQDEIHGQGTYKFANRNQFVGAWLKGKMSGQGVLTCNNGPQSGQIYIGSFKDSNTYHSKLDGSIFQAEFIANPVNIQTNDQTVNYDQDIDREEIITFTYNCPSSDQKQPKPTKQNKQIKLIHKQMNLRQALAPDIHKTDSVDQNLTPSIRISQLATSIALVKCPCGKFYNTRVDLCEHQQTCDASKQLISEQRVYTCICEGNFLCDFDLKNHQKDCQVYIDFKTDSLLQPIDNNPIGSIHYSNIMVCNCGNFFTSVKELNIHQQTCQQKGTHGNLVILTEFPCACDSIFYNQQNLENHQRQCKQYKQVQKMYQFQCNLCECSFSTQQQQYTHQQTHQNRDK